MHPPTEDELDFVDEVGRYFVRQFGLPPVTGRVVGWLLICDPPDPTAAQLTEALGISRSAVGSSIAVMEKWALVQRTRRAGERADRISLRATFAIDGLESPGEYEALGALARAGLDVLADASPARRARLAETAAFADFLVERMPQLATEWLERREALRAAGELP